MGGIGAALLPDGWRCVSAPSEANLNKWYRPLVSILAWFVVIHTANCLTSCTTELTLC